MGNIQPINFPSSKCKSPGVIQCTASPECGARYVTTPSPRISTVVTSTSSEVPMPTTVSGLFASTTTGFVHMFGVLTQNFVERLCTGRVRLGFVIDGSRRVSSREFEVIKFVIEGLTNSIMPVDYGQFGSSLKVAISQIGDETEKPLRFQSKQNVVTLNHKIQDLELQNAREAKINSALRELLEDYQIEISEEGNDTTNVTDRVLFLVTYTPADEALKTALRSFQDINVRVIILSSADGPSEEELQNLLTSPSLGYHINSMEEFTEDEIMTQRVSETICDGEFVHVPNTTTPHQTVTTTLTPTTTSTHEPDEACTMQADLVIIIDLQLLKNSDAENTYFMQLLRSVISQILVTPDRTHITILLADSRVWRISRFASVKEELISILNSSLPQKVDAIPAMEHFDLQFALNSAAEGYLLSERSGARTNVKTVHKSILIFQGRQAYLPKPSDQLRLDKTLLGLMNNDIVLTVVTQTGIFPSDIAGKTDWISTVSSENLIFADVSHQATTRTNFERIVQKLCRSPAHFPIPPVYCEGKMDILFLWDHSSGTSVVDLKNMIDGTTKIIGSLAPDSLGNNENASVRISIAEFGNNTNFLLEANQSVSVGALLKHKVFNKLQWNLGSVANLGKAMSEAASRFGDIGNSRNKTLITFISQTSFDDISSAVQKLKEINVNQVVIGFGQDIDIEQLQLIGGEDGFYRKIASSTEILGNDLGLSIVEKVCTPATYIPPTPHPQESTPESTMHTSTPASPVSSVSEGPVAVCSMSSDMVVVYDSSLTSDNSTLSVLEEILDNLEIGDKKQASRVGIIVANENPMIISNLDEGSNKGDLMEIFNELRNINQSSPVLFPLAKAIKMANEFVLNRRRRSSGDIPVKKDILIITNRLPKDELNLVREDSLNSVKSTIADLLEQDVNVYMIYKGNTFEKMSNDMKLDWLRAIHSNSFHLEESDNPKTLGNEVLDVMCSVPTKPNVTLTPSVPSTEQFTQS